MPAPVVAPLVTPCKGFIRLLGEAAAAAVFLVTDDGRRTESARDKTASGGGGGRGQRTLRRKCLEGKDAGLGVSLHAALKGRYTAP